MFYICVTKVDQDVAHVAMAIHVCFNCMFQLFLLFLAYVASVSSGCCKSRSECCICMHVASVCFRGVLQVFHIDVAKVDRDVAHVAMAIHVCFKCMFRMFHLFFHTYVCKCFIWMLHMFLQVFEMYVPSVSVVSVRILQVFFI